MQPMNSEKPTNIEMWWPSPEALKDLTVEDAEEGFTLSAPDGSDCAAWLNYWNCSEEHLQVFNEAFVEMLRAYLYTLENEHGETEAIPDQQGADREQTENDLAGVQS